MNVEKRKKARRLSISNRELLIASTESDLEKVNVLIKAGVDVNFKDRDGNTPLHWAVESGDVRVVKLLLSKGASVSNKNNKDKTPKDISKQLGKQDVIKIFKMPLESKSPTTVSQFVEQPNKGLQPKLINDSTPSQQNGSVVETNTVSKREKTKNAVLDIESMDAIVANKLLLTENASINNTNNKEETPIDTSKNLGGQEDVIRISETPLESKSPTLSQLVELPKKGLQPKLISDSTSSQQNDIIVETNTVSKREKTKNAVHGNIYQLKLLMLFLYRGVSHKYSFRLGTEVQEAKKFDDLVFEYKVKGKTMYRLLQAKHRLDENKKINVASLLSENDGDYSLMKYFFSYLESKKDDLFKDGLIQDVTICTNIDFDIKDLDRKKISVERILKQDEILDVSGNRKGSARYKFSEDIVKLLKSKLQFYNVAKFKHLKYSDHDIKDFLKHLVFAVNQPNEEEVGCIVKSEISKEFDFITAENVYNKFFITMLNWLQGKEKGVFLSYEDGKEFFEEINRGIQFWFGVKSPVESFTGRTKLLKDLHRTMFQKAANGAPQFVCISGLGGVGKSELVRKYISDYSHEYDNKVVWINAESYEDLADSFRRLACDQLKISIVNADKKEKKLSSIVEDVYTFFSDRKCLFIFDNAEKYKSQGEFDHGIETFLPFLPAGRNQLHVLITSRNQKWPKNVKVIPVSVFNEIEAIAFIKRSLDLEGNAECKEIKRLANELQLFPLALQQAVAYIRMQNQILQNVGSEFNISDYLEKCNLKAKEFLTFNFSDDSDSDYSKTIYSTWNVTFDAIRQKESGKDACEFLEVLAFFAPVDIPASMVKSLVRDETKLASAIELLKQFSMVSVQDGTLNLHRLVLKITRLHLQDDDREKKVLLKALKLLGKHLNAENVEHAISVWNYSSKYPKLTGEFAWVASNTNGELLRSKRYEEVQLFGPKVLEHLSAMPLKSPTIDVSLRYIRLYVAEAFSAQGKYSDALEHFEVLYNIQEHEFGPENSETIYTKRKIADMLIRQGKYERGLKLSEELIVSLEKVCGRNHPDIMHTLNNIGLIHYWQGRYNKALPILQNLLKTKEIVFGTNHASTVSTKSAVVSVLARLNRCDESLKLSHDVLRIGKEDRLDQNVGEIQFAKSSTAILMKQGKFHEGLQMFKKVYESQKQTLGENHPDIIYCRRHIAGYLGHLGRLDESLQILKEILVGIKQALGPDHPEILKTQLTMAHMLAKQGNYKKALALFQEVLMKNKALFGDEDNTTLEVRKFIGNIFEEMGEYEEALKHYRQTLEIQRKIYGEDHYDTLLTKRKMVYPLRCTMQFAEAIKFLREDHANKQEAPADPNALSTKVELAATLFQMQGKTNEHDDEALQLCQEFLDAPVTTSATREQSLIVAKNIIAQVLFSRGKHGAALKLLRELSKVGAKAEAILGPDTVKLYLELFSLKVDRVLIPAKNNNLERLKAELEDGGDVDAADEDDRTLLRYSVDKGNASMAEFLIKSGADITLACSKGNTPLHTAALKRNGAIAEMLLRNISPKKLSDFVNAKTVVGGATALHVAAKNGSLDIVRCILKHGAIYEARNKRGETPSDLCMDEGISCLLKAIEESFEDAKSGSVLIIERLEQMGIDDSAAALNARNSQGSTILQVAIVHKHTDIARKLSEIMKKKM